VVESNVCADKEVYTDSIARRHKRQTRNDDAAGLYQNTSGPRISQGAEAFVDRRSPHFLRRSLVVSPRSGLS
jgi:hypothetical protein